MRNKAFLELQLILSLTAKPLIRYWDFSSSLLRGGFIFLHQTTSSSPEYSRNDKCQQRTQSAPKLRHLPAPPLKEKPWEHRECFQPALKVIPVAVAGQKQHWQASRCECWNSVLKVWAELHGAAPSWGIK